MNNAAFEMLIASFGAGACWTLWFYFMKEYRIDAFRERLFSIRDELFSFAAEGKISFDNPAYTELRSLINGMLRFAHRFTFLTLLISARTSRSEEESPLRRWEASLASLPQETRNELERIHYDLFSAYMNQLVAGSITLRCVSAMLFVAFTVRAQSKKFFSSQKSEKISVKDAMVRDLSRTLNTQVLETEAYREGKASEKMRLSPA